MTLTAADLENWIPARVFRREDDLYVDWCYIGQDRFADPFFDDTLSRRMNRPFSALFRHQTPIEFFGELHREEPGIYPSGFIFHMSRCGSTLAAQMLAKLPQNIVISEAAPLDSVLRCGESEEYIVERLRWTASALGRKRFEGESKFFIKFDSWNTLDMGAVRKAFPDVPWIFLYRNPVEVIVSQMRQRGAQMIQGGISLPITGLTAEQAYEITTEEYCARVLGKICESALVQGDDPNGLFVNYNELPEIMTEEVSRHFNIEYPAEDIEEMKSVAQFNSKTRQLSFTSDTKDKRESASDASREAAAKFVDPLYEKLEAIRNGKG